MSNPLYHEPEIQGRAPLELANPDVYERIGNSFNCVDRFIFALRCIMASPTRHFVPRIDVVSRRKERRPGPIWADRSLTIEFSAPDGDGYLDLLFSDSISATITHHQVANIVADLADLLSFIPPHIWRNLGHPDRYRVILLAIPSSLVERHGLHRPGALTLSAKAAPRARPGRIRPRH